MNPAHQQITLVLTSCGRFDLLETTLKSFFSHDDAELIDHFILTEDSGDPAVYQVLEQFQNAQFDVIFNAIPRGQLPSIDTAYQRVTTPYIFHCEDDWHFSKSGFIKPSLVLLEDFKELVQVLIRDPREGAVSIIDVPLVEHKSIRYRPIDPTTHPIWHGYSFNPGLRRRSDYERLGPFRLHLNEANISIHAKELGYHVAALENGGVQDIGKHRHVSEIFWRKPNVVQRLRNSIRKRKATLPSWPDMTTSLPISCFIVAHNEADRIERAMISVRQLVDEIIVVDSGSTDETVKIAESYGAKVFHQEWSGDGPQKRFAEDQCSNNWLLNIDADEWLDIELVGSIRRLFAHGDPDKPVWCLRRGDIYFGDRAMRWHMNLEHLPRLYDRRKSRFTAIPLHTSVSRPAGKTGTLNGVLYHAHARKVGHMVQKEMHYARVGMRDRSLPVLIMSLFCNFPQCFLKHYFLRHHILGGQKGFAYSMIRAYVRFLRTAMEIEKKLGWTENEAQRPTLPPLSAEALQALPALALCGYIIAYNEADRIGRALASMQSLAREIVVIDSGSTDGTQAIAESYGARVIHHDWEGYGKQKQFATTQIPRGWVLHLDADEWLDQQLIQSIRELFKDGKPEQAAYALGRNDVYLGRIENRTFMKRHHFPRLYDSRQTDYNSETVVEGLDRTGSKIKTLKGRMFHIAVRSIWQVAEKENAYSDLEQQRISKPLRVLSWRLFFEMPIFFVKFYIIRGCIFGGLQGFCYAMIYSFARFQRILKLLENQAGWRR